MKSTDQEYWDATSSAMYPHVVRSSWRRRFLNDARDAPCAEVDEDALWQKLESQLHFSSSKRSYRHAAWLAPLAALAAGFATFLLWPSLPQDRAYDGIKSGSIAPADSMHIKSLRFAVVNASGKLDPGENNMQVTVGTPLVFSLESGGLESGGGMLVDLSYERLPFAEQTSIATILVEQEKVMVRGKNGYVAFTPDRPGYYVIRASQKNSGGVGHAENHDLSVSVRVVSP